MYHFLLTVLGSLVLFVILMGIRRESIKDNALKSTIQVESLGELIESHFQSIKSDLIFLAKLEELHRDKDQIPHQQDWQELESEYLEFSRSKHEYDQIFYLDSTGKELIRIDNNSGFPIAVTGQNLKNLNNQNYFTESQSLKQGEIYMSPMELYKEKGIVEIPKKPIVSFATALHDEMDQFRGVMVINYLARSIIQILDINSRTNSGTFSLLNDDGFWLFNDNPAEEWEFLYPRNVHSGLKTDSPVLWSKINENSGMNPFEYDSKFYTVLKIHPLGKNYGSQNSPSWFLVYSISFDEMNVSWGRLLRRLILYTLLVSLALSIPVGLVVWIVDQRNSYREVLEHSALYDPLTDLPNRLLLSNTASQLIKDSNRYKQIFALMYIDLDGFKNVNDTLGHEGGDILLKIVSQKMQDCVRESDTVARIGGDEFVVLLHRGEQGRGLHDYCWKNY